MSDIVITLSKELLKKISSNILTYTFIILAGISFLTASGLFLYSFIYTLVCSVSNGISILDLFLYSLSIIITIEYLLLLHIIGYIKLGCIEVIPIGDRYDERIDYTNCNIGFILAGSTVFVELLIYTFLPDPFSGVLPLILHCVLFVVSQLVFFIGFSKFLSKFKLDKTFLKTK